MHTQKRFCTVFVIHYLLMIDFMDEVHVAPNCSLTKAFVVLSTLHRLWDNRFDFWC